MAEGRRTGRTTTVAEIETARSLLDQLLSESRLYGTGPEFRELLNFLVRLRKFAPFNALLLQLQKPGLTWAASAREWREDFGRWPRPGARPLIILWPMGPVAFVYDVLDTDGKALPESVSAFSAEGFRADLIVCFNRLKRRTVIRTHWIDAGDGLGGSIRQVQAPERPTKAGVYEMCINRNHSEAIQFSSVAHELGHLFLGHLGPDKALDIPKRRPLTEREVEFEAESVAFLVGARNGVTVRSARYLAHYVTPTTTIDDLDLYQVARAAGQVEEFLGLTIRTEYDRPLSGRRGQMSLL
jgi:hypothetical protein